MTFFCFYSASHVIPLSCSCPIDFEFQVHCLQPHKAFTVKPLSGNQIPSHLTYLLSESNVNQYKGIHIDITLVGD